jgi:hypothetical protein
MVLFALLDLSLQTSWWVTKKIYYAGKYMIYGSQKSEAELREERVEAKLDEILKHESEILKHEAEILKHEELLLKQKEEIKKVTNERFKEHTNIRHSL